MRPDTMDLAAERLVRAAAADLLAVRPNGWVTVIDAEPPADMPSCATVRRGSIRPCSNWTRHWFGRR